MMNEQQMLDAGRASQQWQWTDKELLDQIKALDLTLAYLKGRTDCKLIVFALEMERNRFLDFKASRGI